MIKVFEGLRPHLYDDAGGHCTIGYGHLVHSGRCNGSEPAEFKAGISEARATEIFRTRLENYEATVRTSVTVELTQSEYDALVSFCFNIGAGAFRRSTLLRLLNQGDRASVPTELAKWVRSGGRVISGLQRRRGLKADLFSNGTYPLQTRAQTHLSNVQSIPSTDDLIALGIDITDIEGGLSEVDYGTSQSSVTDWCQIRHDIIRSAVEMQGHWLANGTFMNESNASVFDKLVRKKRDA